MSKQEFHLPLIVTLNVALFLIVLNFTLTALASPYIVSDLGGDRYISSYALSFFGFGTAIAIPLARPLSVSLSVEKLFLYSLITFAITSLICALAPTYFLFVVGRFLMGIVCGPFYGIFSHTFSQIVPLDKKAIITSTLITIFVVVPVIGASYGGTIAYLYNWRAPFFANIFFAIGLTGILAVYLKEVKIEPMTKEFDWIGWIFYALGMFCLAFALTTAQQLDWYRSPMIVSSVAVGVPCFGYYLLRSFTHEAPPMDLRLFKNPLFSLAIVCFFLLFFIYFGIIVLLSIWLSLDVQFTPLWIGILIGTMGIAGLFPYFMIEEKYSKIDPLALIAFAIVLLGISCFYTTIFDAEINFGRIAFSRILAGFGLALLLPPIFKIISVCNPPEKWSETFSLFQSIRNLSSGLGAAIFIIAWQRRSIFYHERLGEELSLESVPTETFFKKLEELHVSGEPLAQLNHFLDRRAASLALDDIFYLMGWILTGLFVIVLSTLIIKPINTKLKSFMRYSPAPKGNSLT